MILRTPAYIFDEAEFTRRLALFSDLRHKLPFKLLYSVKALPLRGVLERMLPFIDGFSASSLFEAKLASEVLDRQGQIHITTPGFRAAEMAELSRLCDHISLNSLTQWRLFSDQLDTGTVSAGLRINPQLSFLNDDRYDPCRPHSKLGTGLDLTDEIKALKGLRGLHFHNMFAGNDVQPLQTTINKIESQLGELLPQLEWLNLGGGYEFNDTETINEFEAIVAYICQRYDLTVFFEPGKGIIDTAGELICEVIDMFPSEGKMIAVLDTSVCHHPEIFEYQRSPEIQQANDSGEHEYIIVGSSCMSGDWLGEYRFTQPLKLKDRLTLINVGAYSLVKANQFNGINLPDVYLRSSSGTTRLIKRFSYEQFKVRWG